MSSYGSLPTDPPPGTSTPLAESASWSAPSHTSAAMTHYVVGSPQFARLQGKMHVTPQQGELRVLPVRSTVLVALSREFYCSRVWFLVVTMGGVRVCIRCTSHITTMWAASLRAFSLLAYK